MANRVVISGVDTNALPKVKAKDLEALMLRLKAGDVLAREEFVIANLRLVLSIVQRFVMHPTKADDMFQVGCVGLMKAIDNFDVSLGLKFSTYAVPMVIGEIRRYLRDNNSIRVSRSLRDIAYKALQIKEDVAKRQHRDASLEEIASLLDLPVSKVSYALDAISETISLSDPIYNDGSETVRVMDQIADPSLGADLTLENLAIYEALGRLSTREKEIVRLRYYEGKTQMEVSTEIGISQAQVSRLEKSALDIIKKNIS